MNNFHRKYINTLTWLVLFSAAMAYVEAMIMVYLHQLNNPGILVIFQPALVTDIDLKLEFAREIATMIMILSVALLAETRRTRRLAAFIFIFGCWDVFYYVWLKLAIGWPVNWFEWDILFLIPWIWLESWLTPVCIYALFIIWSTKVILSSAGYHLDRFAISLLAFGALFVVSVFLEPALPYLQY